MQICHFMDSSCVFFFSPGKRIKFSRVPTNKVNTVHKNDEETRKQVMNSICTLNAEDPLIDTFKWTASLFSQFNAMALHVKVFLQRIVISFLRLKAILNSYYILLLRQGTKDV